MAAVAGVELLVVALIAGFQIAVDPFGVWGTPVRSGFNNVKRGQLGYDRLFKTYQYAQLRPRAVFLGNSRVAFGMPPAWPGVPRGRVYNLGINNIHAPETEKLADFILAGPSRPALVVLGVDMLFLNDVADDIPEAFSAARLEDAAGWRVGRLLGQIRETVFSLDAISLSAQTLKMSRAAPRLRYYDERGWYVRRGEQRAADTKEYVSVLWYFLDGVYRRYRLSGGNVDAVLRVVRRLTKAGIEVRLFMVPESADLLLALDVNGKWAEMEKAKRRLAAEVRFWDFANVNSVSRGREQFMDPAHFSGRVGEMVTARLTGKGRPAPADFGVAIDKKNVDAELARMRREFNAWRAEHQGLAAVLQAAKRHRNEARFQVSMRTVIGDRPPSPKRTPVARATLSAP